MPGEISNLPAEIVRKLLSRGQEVARSAAEAASGFVRSRAKLRDSLSAAKLIHEVGDMSAYAPLAVSAIDGAVIAEKKRFGDICTAIAVEAVFPAAGEKPKDGGQDCDIWMESVRRHAGNGDAVSAVMSSMELLLAIRSESEMVMVDGSFLSTLINISTGIRAARAIMAEAPSPLGEKVMSLVTPEMREAVMRFISSRRHVAFPKYTTTNEFASVIPAEFAAFDAKTVATIALEPGEMTLFFGKPATMDLAAEARKNVIGPSLGFKDADHDLLVGALRGIQSFYYKPHPWCPAYRIDVTAEADSDPDWLGCVLRTVSHATRFPGIYEPLQLYLADLWAKQVSVGVSPVVDMAALSHVTDPLVKIMFALDYRTMR